MDNVLLDIVFNQEGALKNITDFSEKASGQLNKVTAAAGGIGSSLMVVPAILAGLTLLATTLADKFTSYEKAVQKAGEASAKEFVKIKALVEIARDENQARETRLKAIQNLQKAYPEHLKNLSLEKINSEETAKAIDNLTNSIFKKALADALSNKITELTIRELDLQAKKAKLAERALKSVSTIRGAIEQQLRGGGLGILSLGVEATEIENELKQIQKEKDQLGKEFVKNMADTLEFVVTNKGRTSAANVGKQYALDFRAAVKPLLEGDVYEIALRLSPEFLQRELEESRKQIKEGLEGYKVKVNLAPIPLKLAPPQDILSQEQIDIAKGIARSLSEPFAEFFDLFPKNENRIKAFFNSLIQSINAVIRRLIAAAAEAAIFNLLTGGKVKSVGSILGSALKGIGGTQSAGPGTGFAGISVNVAIAERNGSLVAAVNSQTARNRRLG
ncbi:MAG: hypothetical protein J0M30_14830 [Chitinophagales bacterium]|nr:hypothetical protein [Chitinophagales bacterium]